MSNLSTTWKLCIWKILWPANAKNTRTFKWGKVIRFDPFSQKPQSSCFAKWYSWKAVKNRVALVRSNTDPAGRVEQLKESPGERWERLKATEDLSCSRFTLPPAQLRVEKLYIDINIARDTETALITQSGGKRWRSPVLHRHFLFNLICCISCLICGFLHKTVFTSSHDSAGSAGWTQSKSRNLERNRELGADIQL